MPIERRFKTELAMINHYGFEQTFIDGVRKALYFPLVLCDLIEFCLLSHTTVTDC